MKVKLVITVLAIVGLAAHSIWPEFKVDPVSLVFALLALLPWLNTVIKSMEIPGVLKIELQDAKAATRKLVESARIKNATARVQGVSSMTAVGEVLDATARVVVRINQVGATDPNLALVAAGIEVEKALRELAEEVGLEGMGRPVGQLLHQLEAAKVVPQDMASGLRDLFALRNRAAHGAEVSQAAAVWVLGVFGPTLECLSELIRGRTHRK